MTKPPKKPDESIFSNGVGYHIIWVGLLMGFICVATQAFAINNKAEHWQTMVFTVLSMSQLGHALAISNNGDYLFAAGILRNRFLVITIILTFVLQLIIIYLPVCNEIFKTHPLSILELLACCILSTVVFHAVEFEKWIKKKQALIKV